MLRPANIAIVLLVAVLAGSNGSGANPEDADCSGGDETCARGEVAAPVPFQVSAEHKNLVRELHKQLDELNKFEEDNDQARKSKCANTRALVVHVGGYCKQKGFGGNMWGLGEAFKYAYNTKRMLVFADKERWVYVDERDCPSQSWECYFERVASCGESDLNAPPKLGAKTWLSAASHAADERVMHWDNCQFRQYEAEMLQSEPSLASWFQVPPHFRALTSNMGGLNAGWYGAAIDYALRPRSFILERVEEVKRRLRWRERRRPSIGVHVRRGEKWTDCGQPCMRRDVEMYLQAARKWKAESEQRDVVAFTDVYVATDGDTVMKELREQFPEFRYFYNEQQYRDDTGEFEYILKTWKFPKNDYLHINRTECMVNTLVDLILLSECDAFIGTGMSNFSNMAYALLLARLGVPLAPPCALKARFSRGGRPAPQTGEGPCVGPLQHAADGGDFSMLKGFG